MKDYRELAWQMERIIHKYSKFEKKPQEMQDELMKLLNGFEEELDKLM